MAFGELLREARKRRGMSQGKVAKKAGCSPGYVGLIETGERGQHPRLELVLKMAQAVEATVPETEAMMRATGHLAEGEPLVPEGRLTVADAIMNDRMLTTKQRDALLTHYRAYVP